MIPDRRTRHRLRRLLRPLQSLGRQVAAILLLASALLAAALLAGGRPREAFVPGFTSDGHHVVQRSCQSCHQPWRGVTNERCLACHRAELAEDTHAVRTFDDPRWARTLEKVDATRCATCHREHRVAPHGVTVAAGFCFECHDDVVVNRASHRGFSPRSCSTSGCHNFHDNRALNVAFLTRHLDEPALKEGGALPEWGSALRGGARVAPDAPADVRPAPGIVTAWRQSAHAAGGVGCMECHRSEEGGFRPRPDVRSCEKCHGFEMETFQAGKHGVRHALGLPDLHPRDARRPMTDAARRRPAGFTCWTCHDAHSVDTRPAAVDACLSCHDDAHSRAYRASKHAALAADGGRRHGGRSVTCATCHMPRVTAAGEAGSRIAVSHSNTWTLRPRDRMVKAVCLHCHGLEFAMASVFDDDLVARNFQGTPSTSLETFRMLRREASPRSAMP